MSSTSTVTAISASAVTPFSLINALSSFQYFINNIIEIWVSIMIISIIETSDYNPSLNSGVEAYAWSMSLCISCTASSI